jgi:hypothetical protein
MPLVAAMVTAGTLAMCSPAEAGGPRWVAGTVYFNQSMLGKSLVWANGNLVYYTDQGELSSYESNTAAAGLVAQAAAPWTQVATAAVTISQGGTLQEDVSGMNVSRANGAMVWPADVESTAEPVAVIYDADGTVLNTLLGPGASDPSGCLTNAVYSMVNNFTVNANIAHAIIILNGLCAGNAEQIANMQYLLTREFGRVLGLDWSQANDNVFTGNPEASGQDYAGWPLMHPINLDCGSDSYSCVSNPYALRMDDRAALGRLYPSSTFSSSTIRIHGTISFAGGQGMQGVNVKATLLAKNTNTTETSVVATCVSGYSFRGNAGNPVTGTTDANGNSLQRFGRTNPTGEGQYELSGLEIPAGNQTADYEITFEAINPLYTGAQAVGPEILGTPAPSGTFTTYTIRGLKAGVVVEQDVVVGNSATAGTGVAGSMTAPTLLGADGSWTSWLNGYGDTAWVEMSARAQRIFSVITEATGPSGAGSTSQAMPVIGAWFADDPVGSPPDFYTTQAFNSETTGVTVLMAETPAGDGALAYPMVLAVADARGDGRPDYSYAAQVLYADTVSPDVVPASGGVVAISGMGFSAADTVWVNGQSATLLSASAYSLLIQAPTLGNLPSGVDVEVDDPTGAATVLLGALTYGSSVDDTLAVVSVPGGAGAAAGTVGAPAPGSFTVQAIDGNGKPAAGVNVTLSVANGSLLSACGGRTGCVVAASNQGLVSTTLTPTRAGTETVTASLADGANVQAQWVATTASGEILQFAAAPMFVEAGSAITWPVSLTALKNGVPMAGSTVNWSVMSGSTLLSKGSSATNASGSAAYTATIPSMTAGKSIQVKGCLGDGTCTTVAATSESPAAPVVIALTGTAQTIPDTATLAMITLLVTDGAVPGNPLAGASVILNQTLSAYIPPAAPGEKLPPAKILAQQQVTVVTGWNGNVSIQPLQQVGTPATLTVTATVVTGAGTSHLAGSYSEIMAPVTSTGTALRRDRYRASR